jgi:hypothetical protein
MEAVATPAHDHALDTRERLDSRRLAAVDVDVLVRDSGNVRPRESAECRGVDRAASGIDAEMLEVRRRGAIR